MNLIEFIRSDIEDAMLDAINMKFSLFIITILEMNKLCNILLKMD